MTEGDGPYGAGQGMPLCEAARMAEELMASLNERLEEVPGRQGVNKWLGRAARSVEAEHQQLRRHLDRGDEEQVILSMERLLRKIVRFWRRF